MQWHDAHEFFAMGGYALYVWGAYGLTALLLTLEPLLTAQRHRAARRAIAERLADEAFARAGGRS